MPPASSQAFLDSIRVVIHVAYTDGAYANVAQVIEDIEYLGLTAVRNGISDGYDPITRKYNGSAPVSTCEPIAASHAKFTFLIIGGGVRQETLSDLVNLQTCVVAETAEILRFIKHARLYGTSVHFWMLIYWFRSG